MNYILQRSGDLVPIERLYKQREWSFRDWVATRSSVVAYDPSGLERIRREERQEGEMACKHQNHDSYYVCMRETADVHIHQVAEGPGRCISVRTLTRTPRVFTLGTPPRCAARPVIPMVRSSRWSCLIRLQARWPRIDIFAWVFQAIGREIARPRHILYAYANRPRLPPSLSIRLSVRLPRVQPFSLASCFSVVTPRAQTRPLCLTLSLSHCRLFDLHDPYQYWRNKTRNVSRYCVLQWYLWGLSRALNSQNIYYLIKEI